MSQSPPPSSTPSSTQPPISEETIEAKPAPFYHRHKKTGKPTKEMIGTRAIILELARTKSALNKRRLSKRCNLDMRTTLKYCRDLSKNRILKIDNLTRNNQTIPLYSLSDEGKIAALGISVSETEPTGLDHKALVSELVSKSSAATPLHRFGKRFLELFIEQGREDIPIKWFNTASYHIYGNPLPDYWAIIFLTAAQEMTDDQTKILSENIDSVFQKIGQRDANLVKHFFKTTLTFMVLHTIIGAQNDAAFEYFRDLNPDIYLPHKCKLCGHLEQRKVVTIPELMKASITGRTLKCRKCKRTSKADYAILDNIIEATKNPNFKSPVHTQVKPPNPTRIWRP